jgi:hypothetical protein
MRTVFGNQIQRQRVDPIIIIIITMFFTLAGSIGRIFTRLLFLPWEWSKRNLNSPINQKPPAQKHVDFQTPTMIDLRQSTGR